MTRQVSPLQLEILLQAYYSPEPWPGDRSAPEYRQAVAYFLTNEMLTASSGDEDVYELTERGNAYVEAILSTPFPTKTWVIEI